MIDLGIINMDIPIKYLKDAPDNFERTAASFHQE